MSRGVRAARAAAIPALAVIALACGDGRSQSLRPPISASNHAFFPFATGAHAGISCDDCHGHLDTFRAFDCVTCHGGAGIDSAHAAVAGYARESAACYRCHPDGAGLSRDAHAQFFPVASGTAHAAIACASCHLDPSNRLLLGCSACHDHAAATSDAQHSLVRGYASESELCVRCHADGEVTRVATHGQGIVGGPHDRVSCFACHPAMRGDKAWATDFRRSDCSACHPGGPPK
jgi:predicted CXXCH cytochrome family protein